MHLFFLVKNKEFVFPCHATIITKEMETGEKSFSDLSDRDFIAGFTYTENRDWCAHTSAHSPAALAAVY